MKFIVSAFTVVLIFSSMNCGGSYEPAEPRTYGNHQEVYDKSPQGLHGKYLLDKNTFEEGKKYYLRNDFSFANSKFISIENNNGYFYKAKETLPSIYEYEKTMIFYTWFDSIKTFLKQNIDLANENNQTWAESFTTRFGIVNTKLDSIKLAKVNEKELEKKSERKWVYMGDFNGYDKYGNETGYAPIYYDENHLLYEGDSVCVVLKKGDFFYVYKYVSLNLKTKVVHGIDLSDYSGESYNYVWDGDWWRENNEFADRLYLFVKR